MAGPYFGFTTFDADSITVMAAGGLNLEGQSPWQYWNTGDSPEGAWMAFGVLPPLTATVTLPAPMVGGTTYYIFIYMISYDVTRTVTFTVGGATSTAIQTNDRDFTVYWSNPAAVVTPGVTSSTLIVNIGGNDSAPNGRLFRGLYITTNPLISMLANGTAVNLVFPTVMDDSPPVKGNLIPNSGFETGIDTAWGFPGGGGGRMIPLVDMWDATGIGHSGSGCIKLRCDPTTRNSPGNTVEQIISRVYHLKPNKTYTASAYLKTSPGLTTSVKITLRNTFVPPAGFTPQYFIESASVGINSSTWTRVSVTGYAVAYPSPDFQIYIDTSAPDGTYLLIDDVQLEEGPLDVYMPAADVEAGLVFDATATPGNIYYTTDTLTASLVVRNHKASPRSRTLSHEIYDFNNALVASGTTALTIPAATTQTAAFNINPGGKRGIFRIVLWLDNETLTEREYTYAVIPAPAVSGVDVTSYLGVHPDYYDRNLGVFQRLGIKWVRDLSPAGHGRWEIVEPSDNTFIFYDAPVATAISHGMTCLCVLGAHQLWPAWADNAGLPNLPKYFEFCTQMVAHYKGLGVKYWEVWNEPDFTAAFYAQMLKGATDAIKAEDPTAKVVGIGGRPAEYIQDVIHQLESQFPTWPWQSKIDVLSMHHYPDGAALDPIAALIDTYGKPIWNTESGDKDLGFKQGPNSSFVEWGKSIWPHIPANRFNQGMTNAAYRVVKAFLRTIAGKQTNYFYYDARLYATPDYFLQIFSILDYDDSIKCKGIAYAIAGSLVYQATSLGNIVSGQNAFVLVFNAPAAPIAALFAADNRPKQIVLSLSGAQFEVLDMMGNVLPGIVSPIPFGRIPIYVRGLGITAATLAGAFGAITARTDSAPPRLSISDGPRGQIPVGSSFRMRWIASDDTSFPNIGEINQEALMSTEQPNPEALTYAYRLSSSAAWSPWRANTFVDYANVPAGQYTFEVKARDEAGNESAIASRAVQVGEPLTQKLILVMR